MPRPAVKLETLRPADRGSPAADKGARVTIHYVARLVDGATLEDSRHRGSGLSFELGAGQVIQGWDEGLLGMQVGEVRRLTVPPELAYGEKGFPPAIPPDAELEFDIELLAIHGR